MLDLCGKFESVETNSSQAAAPSFRKHNPMLIIYSLELNAEGVYFMGQIFKEDFN